MSQNAKSRRGILGLATTFAIVLAALFATAVAPAYGSTSNLSISNDEVQSRAAYWFQIGPQYDQGGRAPDPNGVMYRTDCSGYVSMAWGLAAPGLTTTGFGNTAAFPVVSWDQVQPGDALLKSGHIVLVHSWSNGQGEIWEMSNPTTDMEKLTLTQSQAISDGYHPIRNPAATPSTPFPVSAPMMAEWERLGVSNVGEPTANQDCTLTPTGCSQPFEKGVMYWSPAHDAKFVGGALLAAYQAVGAQASPLGYPTTSVTACDPTAGCVQNFENGFIYWSAATASIVSNYVVSDQMLAEWLAIGGPATAGMPTAGQTCDLTPDGCSQPFEKGVMYWSPTYGAKYVGGEILARYQALGAQAGGLGYPTQSVGACDPTAGCLQQFEGGAIAWSGQTGPVEMTNVVDSEWSAIGGVAAAGFPTAPQDCTLTPTGCSQQFQKGVMYWSQATGAKYVGGIILAAYQAIGAQASRLGYPTTSVTLCDGTTGCTQYFQGGTIYWSSATGAVVS